MSLAGSIDFDSPAGKFLSIIPPILSVSMFLSPSRTVYGIVKAGTTGELPILPYLSMAIVSIIWGLYGIFVKDVPVAVPNLCGAVLGLIFAACFHCYEKDKRRIYPFYLLAIIAIAVIGYISYYFEENRTEILNIMGVAMHFVFVLSPFATIFTIIRTKTVDTLPFDLSFVMFVNSASWTCYSWLVANDRGILVTAVAGVVISALQLLCHILYGDVVQSLKLMFCFCSYLQKRNQFDVGTAADIYMMPEETADFEMNNLAAMNKKFECSM